MLTSLPFLCTNKLNKTGIYHKVLAMWYTFWQSGGVHLDNLTIFSGNANRQLAAAICKYLHIPLGDADVFQFSNENIFVKINENVRGHDVFLIQSFSSPVNRSIMELLIMIDALKRASAKSIAAVIPYYGYARQDRKDKPRVPITAKLVANLLTVAGATRVLTMDLRRNDYRSCSGHTAYEFFR